MFRRALFCLLRFIVTGVSCLFFLIRKALHTVMFINSQSLAYRKTRLSPLLSVSSSSERRRSVSVLLIQHLWGGVGLYASSHNFITFPFYFCVCKIQEVQVILKFDTIIDCSCPYKQTKHFPTLQECIYTALVVYFFFFF